MTETVRHSRSRQEQPSNTLDNLLMHMHDGFMSVLLAWWSLAKAAMCCQFWASSTLRCGGALVSSTQRRGVRHGQAIIARQTSGVHALVDQSTQLFGQRTRLSVAYELLGAFASAMACLSSMWSQKSGAATSESLPTCASQIAKVWKGTACVVCVGEVQQGFVSRLALPVTCESALCMDGGRLQRA